MSRKEPGAASAGKTEKKIAEREEYELLKPLRMGAGGKLVEPAAEGQPVVMVKLRDDQAKRLAASNHIKMAA